MPLFMLFYIIIAVAVIITVFLLSYNEKGNKVAKTALTVIFIVSVIGIIFATGCLEVKYNYSKLVSSVLAAAILGGMYFADTLGSKFANKKEE